MKSIFDSMFNMFDGDENIDRSASNNYGKGALMYNQKKGSYTYYSPYLKEWVSDINPKNIGDELKKNVPELAAQYTDEFLIKNAEMQDEQFKG